MNVEQSLQKTIAPSTEIGHCSNIVNITVEPIVAVASVDNEDLGDDNSIGNEFSCVICDKCLPTNEDLDEHLLSHAKDNSHNIKRLLRSSKTNSMNKNAYHDYHCCANYPLAKEHLQYNSKNEFVNLLSKSSRIQSQHKNRDTNFLCSNCSDTFTCEEDLQNHMKTHQTYICSFCCVKFPNKDMFESHPCHSSLSVDKYATTEMLNNKDMPFQCYVCGCIFETSHDLKIHLVNHISDSFRCEECGFKFENKRKLMTHRATHPKKIPSCEVCGKVFGHVSLLVKHLRTHTKEKPFTCNICGKKFAEVDYLKTHKRIHTQEKPFLCAECGKAFITQTQLQCHMKIHTNEKSYVCEICKMSFRLPHHLKKHYRIHTQEKPYSCEYCGKAFARRDCLKQHIRVHTKEKPYKCKICGKCFSQGSSVRLHQKVHTKDKDPIS